MDLKPCPFCGSDNVDVFARGGRFGEFVWIECINCGAKTRNHTNHSGAEFGAEKFFEDISVQRVSEAWNRRNSADE